jgi:hypothetical protein
VYTSRAMYCPKCRAEYRVGFTRCSDCCIDLVNELPAETSELEESARLWPDAESLAELWRGEDAVLHDRLIGELKRAGITYESKPTREAAGCGIDPVVRGVEPRYGFNVRIHPMARPAAVEILRKLEEAESMDFSIPVAHSTAAGAGTIKARISFADDFDGDENELRELKCVWEGSDLAKRDFVRASLRENGIVSESTLHGQSYRIFVAEPLQPKAVETVKQIVEGKPPSFEPDDPEKLAESRLMRNHLWPYSLVTGLCVFILFIWLFLADSPNPVFVQIAKFLAGVAILGGGWTIYQVVRYEKRPWIYSIIVLFPFSFVWYYLGRYLPRTKKAPCPNL